MAGGSPMQSVLVARGVKGRKLHAFKRNGKDAGVTGVMRSIAGTEEQGAFFVFDLATVVDLYSRWCRALDGVRPYYAVKCNPEPAMLGAMAALGAGFDCASRAEIEAVLVLGVVEPGSIVYANPCKPEAHLRYAAEVGVNLATYDTEDEVAKVKRCHPSCDLLLRIKGPDNPDAKPGQYFAEKAFTLAARVIGRRARGEAREYWIDDGIYGALSCTILGDYVPRPRPLAPPRPGGENMCSTYASTVFGPTCDSRDKVVTGYQLPEMNVGDWLVFDGIGAYAASSGTNFNGFLIADIKTHLAYST
uniref:Orn/DAP/Arg decarboxylase 2 N-terminal domain-containing protein n=1 Tax=Aegilops tauschii subsp. strangulata TaxID=200361 RepID=A0A453R0F3_AEGTS